MKKYNKLIRDKVPARIKAKGEPVIYHVAEDDAEYWPKLKEKLLEEVNEFMETEQIGEIADILEVIEAICDFKRFDGEKVAEVKAHRADEKGKFINRIILDES